MPVRWKCFSSSCDVSWRDSCREHLCLNESVLQSSLRFCKNLKSELQLKCCKSQLFEQQKLK